MNLQYIKEQKAKQQATDSKTQHGNESAIDVLVNEILGEPIPEFERLAEKAYMLDDMSR